MLLAALLLSGALEADVRVDGAPSVELQVHVTRNGQPFETDFVAARGLGETPPSVGLLEPWRVRKERGTTRFRVQRGWNLGVCVFDERYGCRELEVVIGEEPATRITVTLDGEASVGAFEARVSGPRHPDFPDARSQVLSPRFGIPLARTGATTLPVGAYLCNVFDAPARAYDGWSEPPQQTGTWHLVPFEVRPADVALVVIDRDWGRPLALVFEGEPPSSLRSVKEEPTQDRDDVQRANFAIQDLRVELRAAGADSSPFSTVRMLDRTPHLRIDPRVPVPRLRLESTIALGPGAYDLRISGRAIEPWTGRVEVASAWTPPAPGEGLEVAEPVEVTVSLVPRSGTSDDPNAPGR